MGCCLGDRQRPSSTLPGTTLSAECAEPNKETFIKLTLEEEIAAESWEVVVGIEVK